MNAKLRSRITLVMILMAAAFFTVSADCAVGQVVHFQLYNVVFSDGSNASGTFDYDFTRDSASNISIVAGDVVFSNAGNASAEITTQSISGSYESDFSIDTLKLTFKSTLDQSKGVALSTSAAASYFIIDNSPAGGVSTTLKVVSGVVIPVSSLPTTTASLSGIAGKNGWFRGPVIVKLTAVAGGHPVSQTFYTLDGGEATLYTGSFTVSGESQHTLTYWSGDTAGFVETEHSDSFGIDATAPVTTAEHSGETVFLYGSDDVSGVAFTYYKVNGGAQHTYNGSFFAPVGTDTIVYWSVDVAGNVEPRQTLSFTTGDTMPPSTPVSPHWVVKTATGGTIAWGASTDNVHVVGYRILQRRGHSGRGGGYTWYLIGMTTQKTFNLNTTFSIGVQAIDAAGNRSAIALVP